MPFDATPPAAPTAWSTAADLTPDQHARYGGYVAAKDEVRTSCEANRQRREEAQAALRLTGDDKLAALAVLLGAA